LFARQVLTNQLALCLKAVTISLDVHLLNVALSGSTATAANSGEKTLTYLGNIRLRADDR